MGEKKRTPNHTPAQPESLRLENLQITLQSGEGEREIRVSGAELAQVLSMIAYRRSRGVITSSLALEYFTGAGRLAADLEGLAEVLETLGHWYDGMPISHVSLFLLSEIVKDLAARAESVEDGAWHLRTATVEVLPSPVNAPAAEGGAR